MACKTENHKIHPQYSRKGIKLIKAVPSEREMAAVVPAHVFSKGSDSF